MNALFLSQDFLVIAELEILFQRTMSLFEHMFC